MEIKKLKKLLAEGNPERALENIIEDLTESEGSQIPMDRQIARVESKEGKEEEAEAKLNQLKFQVQAIIASGQLPPPPLTQEIERLEGIVKNREAQTNIANSLLRQTVREKGSGKRDPLSGVTIPQQRISGETAAMQEGESMEKIKNVKFGISPDTPTTDSKNIKIENNKEDFTMNDKQKAIFEQTMNDMFKILKEGDEEKAEVAEVEPGQEEVVAEKPVLEPEVGANDAELAGVEPPAADVTPEEIEAVNAEVAAEVASSEGHGGEAHGSEEAKVTPEEAEAVNSEVESELSAEAPETASVEKAEVEQGTTVTVGPNSINISVPINNPEALTHGMTPVEGEALQEALRSIYAVLSPKKLNEETAEIPANAEAKVEYNEEEGKVVIEIPTAEQPKEQISSEENKQLQEAIAVIEYVLREEKEIDDLIDETSDEIEEEKEDKEEAEASSEDSKEPEVETVEVPVEVEAEVKKSEDSIRIEIPLKKEHKDELTVSEEDMPALEETIRLVYSIFKAKNLTEAETVDVPTDTEASVTKETGEDGKEKLVIEIEVDSPKEKIMEDEAEVLQEAINFLSYMFLNEASTDSSAAKLAKLAAKTAAVGTVPAGLYTAGRLAGGKELSLALADPNSAFYIPKVFDASRHVPMIADNIVAGGGALLGGAAEIATFIAGLGAPAIAALLGIPVATAAIWSRTKAGQKFIATKLNWGKVGSAFKDKKDLQKEIIKGTIGAQLEKKLQARKTFASNQGEYEASEKEAGKGVNWMNKIGSKIPILNKLVDLNLFGWKPFQNKDLQDKMSQMQADVINKYKPGGSTTLKRGLKFDTNTGKVEYDMPVYSALTPAEQAEASAQKVDFKKELGSTKSGLEAIDAIVKAHAAKKAANKLSTAADKATLNTTLANADKEISKAKAIEKDKTIDDMLYDQSKLEVGVKESIKFDVDAAYSLLEGKNFSEEEKLDLIAESYRIIFLAELNEQILSGGYNTTAKGVSLFLESKGIDLTDSEKKDVVDSINSEEVVRNFENYFTGRKASDSGTFDIENKDVGFGETLQDVTAPVINESEELGSAAAEPIATSDAPAKEATPDVTNKDLFPADEHKQTEEVKEVIVEAAKSKKPVIKKEPLNTAHSDTLNASGELKPTVGKEKTPVKAEPKDVTTKGYKSLKEAFLLESDYFEKDSVAEVPAAAKKEKLVGQLGLLVARDVQDPLYEELLRTSATAKKLQEELQSKYRGVALKKADQFLSAKKKSK
jgi:hypothetical protein